jgi:hypothetical protein
VLPLITDSQFNSLALIVIAMVGIIPATLAAYYSKGAKTRSEEAAASSEEAAAEVRTNGGMTDPHPNVNDHIKYQTEMLEQLIERLDRSEAKIEDHLTVSSVMAEALAEVYLAVLPSRKLPFDRNRKDNPE